MILGRCQRSDDIVEPRLKVQWFIRTGPLAAMALEATRAGRTEIVPQRFEKVWEHWLTAIHDWNVSRQLWWGHRIPAWYCPDGHVSVSELPDGPEACETCGRPASELVQDPDIFDTWFSSGLWPFSTLGWPDETEDFRRYYPGTVMETGYDIIFFWVARMMMLGLGLAEKAPFRTVYLHGLVKDPYGKRMSETRGQRRRPPRGDHRIGGRRPALRPRPRNVPGQRPEVPRGTPRRRPELRQQALERDPLRDRGTTSSIPAGTGTPAAGSRPAGPGEALDPLARRGHGRHRRRGDGGIPVRGGDQGTLRPSGREFCDRGLELAKVRLGDAALPEAMREATWWTPRRGPSTAISVCSTR